MGQSNGALRLDAIPERMLVVGAGINRLRDGHGLQRAGARVDVVERLSDLLAFGLDPEVTSKDLAKPQQLIASVLARSQRQRHQRRWALTA